MIAMEEVIKLLESAEPKRTKCPLYDGNCSFEGKECKYDGLCIETDYFNIGGKFCLQYLFPVRVLEAIIAESSKKKNLQRL